MMPVVRISDELFSRLQSHAEPLVDSVSDVISRILDCYEGDLESEPSSGPVSEANYEDASCNSSVEMGPTDIAQFWSKLDAAYNSGGNRFKASPTAGKGHYKKVHFGRGNMHYEWMFKKKQKALDICLHFEAPDRDQNFNRLSAISAAASEIQSGIPLPFETGPFGRAWSEARFRIAYLGKLPTDDQIELASRTMKTLIDRTIDLIPD